MTAPGGLDLDVRIMRGHALSVGCSREVAEYIASLVQQHAGEEAHPPWHPLLN